MNAFRGSALLPSMVNSEWRWNSPAPFGTPVPVSYSFMESVPDYGSAGTISSLAAFSDAQKGAIRLALAEYGRLTGLSFFEASDSGGGGDIRIGRASFTGTISPWDGFAVRPQRGAESTLPIGGDIYLNSAKPYLAELSPLTYGFHTVLHEIGHAVGLKHPHESPNSLSAAEDNTDNTVVSVNRVGEPRTTLGPLDVEALQFLYGSRTALEADGIVYGWNAASAKLTTQGGAGDDWLIGIGHADVAFGNAGDDRIYGFEGDDKLIGGLGGDLLYGQSGDDRLYGEAGDDIQHGGAGADRLDGQDGADDLAGGDGDDKLIGGPGNDTLGGDAGGDQIYGESGDDRIDGGAGPDTLSGQAGDDDLQGGDQEDKLTGGAGDDLLAGGGGVDRLYGEAGSDRLEGGDGDDQLRSGDGDDSLDGGEGDDMLQGGGGGDGLEGAGGNDSLYGGTEDDRLAGGPGDDRLFGQEGEDVVDGGPGTDRLAGDEGKDELDGGPDGDLLWGGGGADILDGGPGNDALRGEAGPDLLRGGPGDDKLWGGEGDDRLEGGPGIDLFHFDPGWGTDIVADFADGVERLDMHATGLAFGDIIIGAAGSDATVAAGDGTILIHGAAGLIGIEDFLF